MLDFVFQKIRNKKWMFLGLLLGNLLLIATAVAGPMYAQAVLQRVFTQELRAYQLENNQYPGVIEIAGVRARFGAMTPEGTDPMGDVLADLIDDLGVPVEVTVAQYRLDQQFLQDFSETGEVLKKLFLNILGYKDLEAHIELVRGEMFSDRLDGNTIEVIVPERTFMEQGFSIGQELEFRKLKGPDGEPYRIRITGVFKNLSDQDPYWRKAPALMREDLVMSMTLFQELFLADKTYDKNLNATWHTVLDYEEMRADRAAKMLETIDEYEVVVESAGGKIKILFLDTLSGYVDEAQQLNATITVLQTPIFVLLAVFVFMVSRQILETEQGEISVYKSRGASKWQIIRLYLVQSLLIAGVALIVGIPLGALFCKLLGASGGFLEFVNRKALKIELSPKVWLFALGAVWFSVATMVLPVIRFADVGIVAYKRKKSRGTKRVWWKIACVDLILLGVALYNWYQYREQEEFLAQQVANGAALDPMLYLSSSLFMLGMGLLFLRLLPIIVTVVFRLGKRVWSPGIYASFLRILRTNDNQGFLVVFLILTVSMGIFSTQLARTINANEEERIRYMVGADLVVQEHWESNIGSMALDEGSSKRKEIIYEEPDFGRYEQMEGIDKVTKVLVNTNVTARVESGDVEDVTVMGIHTREFGEISWFKEELLPVHWYEYLNAIAGNARAILVSSNFRDIYGCRVGDSLRFTNEKGEAVRGIIYGFVDYWPSYAPVQMVTGQDGVTVEKDNFLIVAHLSQLEAAWGVTPYQVWIKTTGSTEFLYEDASENGTKYVLFEDADAKLVELKNDPVFQGTNGVLTIGFIIVLLLCTTGFLIYWILSIKSRTLQFGIFRAMGMSSREVLMMLVNEQIFISGGAILAGVISGIISAQLYVPLIQVGYSASNRVIPLEIISEAGDYIRLGVVIGAMLILCMCVLGVLISRIRISQALKLGED